MSFYIKHIDETLTYNLTFSFRFGHTSQFRKELFAGINANHIQAETFVVLHHILELILTQHTMIYKDTSQVLANSFIQQHCRNRRIDSATQTENDLIITQLIFQFGNRALNKRSRRPVLLAAANIYHKVLQDLSSVLTMEYFRMELNTPYLLPFYLISSNLYFIC